MSSLTSTTGSISVDITSDSLTAPKTIVLREDIFLGTVLVGTTYRNVVFTTTYITPIPRIGFNGTNTTFPTLPLVPEPFTSSTKVTTLTFTNSTVPVPGWDNSVMTLTVT